MSKLFALEELETGTPEVELVAAPEVGEVADVQVEMDAEIAEAADSAEAIDEGMGAADHLDQVEEVVADAVENGEGLDPVAAKSLRVAVESICALIGANPKAMYSLYATENFSSASSRKANSKIALESVGEFLKDLWKKIKAALTRLWEKVKAFWDKNGSSLGRVKKALESMKRSVGESSGKLKDKAFIEEAPTALHDAVGFDGDISIKSFQSVLAAHTSLVDSSESVVEATNKFNAAAGANLSDIEGGIAELSKIGAGKKTGRLVGGVEITYSFEVDKDEATVNLEVERENVDRKDRGGISLAEKNDVKGLLDSTIKLIGDNMKAKEKMGKLQESFNKLSLAIDKAINNEADADKAKALRKGMKVVYKLNAKAPVIMNEGLSLNVKLAKAVLGYSALCLKNYK